MANTTTRILVVEDFTPHRSLIATLLGKNPDLVVISEAVHGQDAVAQAQQLKPDVILLDIDIPKLDGVGAGRQISDFTW